MLFNSYEFIFLFLPIVLSGFFWVSRWGQDVAIYWLVMTSLFFYGWWNPIYLLLIIFSMLFNFFIGERLSNAYQNKQITMGRVYFTAGLIANLALLGYFKYAGFLVDNFNIVTGSAIDIGNIILPLAISFFTFQQIAYLVDAFKGITQEYTFSHYALFVTFFPQLIAGPIVHHGEMLPQFMREQTFLPQLKNIVIGLSIFIIGLFKKVVLADGVARYATPVFDSALAGEVLTFFEAWGGALAYTFQLYFDFSGYSDMAIGIAYMFGIVLPLNFYSPYKATSIIEFWRRWHITLSRFLRDYLYIPLGGNRYGVFNRYRNLLLTMILGGLWHGAGWTFVIWGGLHGMYLVVNHAWIELCRRLWPNGLLSNGFTKFIAWLLTFIAVVVGWVFFRAETLQSAMIMLEGMIGLNGVALPNAIVVHLGGIWTWLQSIGITVYLGGGHQFVFTYLWVILLLLISFVLPNTQQLMRSHISIFFTYSTNCVNEINLILKRIAKTQWQPRKLWALMIGAMMAIAVLSMTSVSEFLYFQF